MAGDNAFIDLAARAARIPFALFARQPFIKPRKVLILQPCCLSQAMLTTPLLAALSRAYPNARFDWAVDRWTRSAVVSNPRLTELVLIGDKSVHKMDRRELDALCTDLREREYDTCFIPNSSSRLAWVAWRAGIGQRVGLNAGGRGFAHTLAVKPAVEESNSAKKALLLAEAADVHPDIIAEVGEEFYPSDRARTEVTRRLVEDIDWLGDTPLVVMHPGGGSNPLETDDRKRWPVERFALLGNHLARKHGARVLLVGSEADRSVVTAVAGMMAGDVPNLAGELTLSEIGALCEIADLYIGNDTGPTHVAAAVGCKTLAIYGPTQPFVSQPYAPKGKVVLLWQDWQSGVEVERPFNWELGVGVKAAVRTADKLLQNA